MRGVMVGWCAGALLLLTGCQSAKQGLGVLGELQSVATDVAKATGHQTVRVNLMNGHALGIGMVNSPFGSLSEDQRRAKAREIATVAYRSFTSRASIDTVTVAFVVHRQYLFFFNYTNALDSFGFKPSEFESGLQATEAVAGR